MKQADAHDILNYHDWDLRKFGACLRGWGASKQRYSCLRSRVNRLGKFTGPDSIFMQMQNRRLKAQWVGRYKWLDDHLQLSRDTDLAHSCHLCIHGDRLDIPEHPTSCLSDRGREREDGMLLLIWLSHTAWCWQNAVKISIKLLFYVKCEREWKPTSTAVERKSSMSAFPPVL